MHVACPHPLGETILHRRDWKTCLLANAASAPVVSPPLPAPAVPHAFIRSHGSEVRRVPTTTNDVGNVTQGHAVPDH